MKKTILIAIFLIMFCVPVFSDDFFSMDYTFDISYYISANEEKLLVADINNLVRKELTPMFEILYSSRMYAKDRFFIGGTTSTVVDKVTDRLTYTPFFSWYLFETGIKFGITEIYYEHLCSHTSTVHGYYYQLYTGLDKFYNRVGIRFSNKDK